MTGLLGGVLLIVAALIGLRLVVAGLVGRDARGSAVRGLGGIALLALIAAPCVGIVSNVGSPSCQNNTLGSIGTVGSVIAAVVVGAVVLAGVLQYISHRRRLDAWLRRKPTSRKKRVE